MWRQINKALSTAQSRALIFQLTASKNTDFFFSVAPRPNASQGFFIEVSGSHTTMHHSRHDSSGRVISSSQRPLTTDKHACPQRESNPQYQQAGGRRLTPWTARPPELVNCNKLLKFTMINLQDWWFYVY